MENYLNNLFKDWVSITDGHSFGDLIMETQVKSKLFSIHYDSTDYKSLFIVGWIFSVSSWLFESDQYVERGLYLIKRAYEIEHSPFLEWAYNKNAPIGKEVILEDLNRIFSEEPNIRKYFSSLISIE